jgi:hypothetical protein
MPSQAQINHFCAHPEQFMKCNAIKWLGKGPEDQAIIDVAMFDETGQKARVRTGSKALGLGNAKADADKFILKWANNPSNPVHPGTFTFKAHWSGYKAGQGRDANLPSAGGPDIMLTPEFTGCTAVCRTNAGGDAQFSHYNLMSTADPTTTLDDDSMRAVASKAYGGGHSTMTKGDVRAYGKHSEAVRATVVGYRRAGRWEFWAQLRESKASGEQIRAVVQL